MLWLPLFAPAPMLFLNFSNSTISSSLISAYDAIGATVDGPCSRLWASLCVFDEMIFFLVVLVFLAVITAFASSIAAFMAFLLLAAVGERRPIESETVPATKLIVFVGNLPKSAAFLPTEAGKLAVSRIAAEAESMMFWRRRICFEWSIEGISKPPFIFGTCTD